MVLYAVYVLSRRCGQAPQAPDSPPAYRSSGHGARMLDHVCHVRRAVRVARASERKAASSSHEAKAHVSAGAGRGSELAAHRRSSASASEPSISS